MIAATALALLAPLGLWAGTRVGAARLAAAFPPTGTVVVVDGVPIHVLDRGPRDGPALVLLHGASGNHRDLDVPLGDRLAPRFRVLAVDRPGQGASGRPQDGSAATPDGQARLIAGALAALGVARATVVGHSLGAAVAAAFAVEHPERTAALILIAPATHPWPGDYVSFHNRVAAAPVIGRLFAATLPLPLGALVMTPAIRAVFRPDPAPEDYAERIGARLVLRPASFRANAEDVVDLSAHLARLAPRYREIAAPTLVIAGAHDPIVSNAIHADGLMRDVPGARRVDLPTGHMPHWTATERVLEEIERFAAR